MLVGAAPAKSKFPQQSRLNQQIQRSVHSRATDPQPFGTHALQELIRLEMIVFLEHVIDNLESFARNLEILEGEKLAKLAYGILTHRNRGKILPILSRPLCRGGFLTGRDTHHNAIIAFQVNDDMASMARPRLFS